MPRWCLRWVRKLKRKKYPIAAYCFVLCHWGPVYLSQSELYYVDGFPLKKYSVQVHLKKCIIVDLINVKVLKSLMGY